MYNRYLRNDDGVYTRMPMQDAPRGEPPRDNRPPPPPPSGGNAPPPRPPQGGAPPPPISRKPRSFSRTFSTSCRSRAWTKQTFCCCSSSFFSLKKRRTMSCSSRWGFCSFCSRQKGRSEEISERPFIVFLRRFYPTVCSFVPSGSVNASAPGAAVSTVMPAMR